MTKKTKNRTCGKQVKKNLRSMDMYGKPVELTFKGKQGFKTKFGGTISLLLLMFLVAISIYKTAQLVNRE